MASQPKDQFLRDLEVLGKFAAVLCIWNGDVAEPLGDGRLSDVDRDAETGLVDTWVGAELIS